MKKAAILKIVKQLMKSKTLTFNAALTAAVIYYANAHGLPMDEATAATLQDFRPHWCLPSFPFSGEFSSL